MGESNENGGSKVELKRTMSLPMIVVFGLAYLSPTTIFAYYGISTVGSSGMMTMACAITTVAMLFTAWSYVQMSQVFPNAGSVYTYTQHAIGPQVGFMAGWVMLLDYLIIPMECFLLMSIYINAYFPAIPKWACLLVLVGISAVINVIGMEMSSIIDTVIVAADVIVLFLFIIVVLKYVTGGGGSAMVFDRTAIYNAETFNFGSVMTIALTLTIAFLGFDAVTTMSEEAKDPKCIPKAILIVVIGAGVMYMIISYLCQIAWPNAYFEIVNEDSAVFELFDVMDANVTSNIFFITDNCASFTCAMSGMAAVSRMLYSMGRDNILPKKVFGKLSPKWHTPILCILIASAVQLCSLFFMDNYEGVVSLVSFGAMSGFALVNLSVIMYFYVKKKKRDAMSTFKFLILPGIGFVISVVLWCATERNTKIMGICWIVFGIIYLAFKTKGFRVLPDELKVKEEEDEKAAGVEES